MAVAIGAFCNLNVSATEKGGQEVSRDKRSDTDVLYWSELEKQAGPH